ncbi:MAG: hypothetical protein IPM24_06100 [Bryobacterales bacterium]|nr:hypothetical protein [Bryobacterales bacterium]
MDLDLRKPLGLLFAVLGLLLAAYGMAGDASVYRKSLGVNVNLWWGGFLLVSGCAVLAVARRGSGR